MQWFRNLLPSDSGALQIVVVAALVVAAALVFLVVYRLVFGHRLRVPGASRARQPRLGLVDAFSLDGQRQLVLVRRDNVEHLVMIGGPNDVLVESQIVRAAAAAPREPGFKAPAAGAEPPHLPVEGAPPRVEAPILRRVEPAPPPRLAARPAPPPVREPPPPPPRVEPIVARVEPPPVRPEPAPLRPAPAARPEPTRVVPPPPPAAASPPAVPPPPPPPIAPPIPAGPLAPPAVPPRPAAPPRAGLPPPIGAPPAIRGRATPPPPPPPHDGPPPPPARADAAPAASPSGEAGATGKPKSDDPFADLESLEAEMARLLGRSG